MGLVKTAKLEGEQLKAHTKTKTAKLSNGRIETKSLKRAAENCDLDY